MQQTTVEYYRSSYCAATSPDRADCSENTDFSADLREIAVAGIAHGLGRQPMRVLQFQEAEDDTLRDILRRNGIECTLDVPPFTVPNYADIEVFGKVWSYRRPQNGQPVWILEIDIYLSMSERVTRSWVLGERPTKRQMESIITSNAQAGTVIE